MLKTKRILGIIITFALLFSLCTNCYATESMAGENLEVSTEEVPKTEEAVKEEVSNDTNAGEDNNSDSKDETAGESKEQDEKSDLEKFREKERQERELEKNALREMEKQYIAEKNRIANAGDTTVLVLKAITVVSIISLLVIIVCNKKIKK